jgi:hypothetical protein
VATQYTGPAGRSGDKAATRARRLPPQRLDDRVAARFFVECRLIRLDPAVLGTIARYAEVQEGQAGLSQLQSELLAHRGKNARHIAYIRRPGRRAELQIKIEKSASLTAAVDNLRWVLAERGLPTVAASEASAWRRLAEREGFEPPCRLPDKTLSRRPRYDHFGTSPGRCGPPACPRSRRQRGRRTLRGQNTSL